MNFDQTAFIYLSTFITSFVGSFHCAGMCGPIVTIVGKSFKDQVLYHLGRLLGYLFITLLAHQIGSATLSHLPEQLISKLTPLFFGLTLIIISLFMLNERSFHIKLPSFLNKPFSHFLNKSAFLVGLFSFTLPCGWLYAFVIGGLTINNPTKSTLLVIFFWLGTLPFLSVAPWLFHQVITPLRKKAPKLFPLIILACGIYLLYLGATKIFGPFKLNQKKFYHAQVQECDLNKKSCLIDSSVFGKINVSLSPRPLKTNQEVTAEIEFSDNKFQDLKIEIDITGHEMDMGYNRPKLEMINQNKFHAKIIFPTCTEEVMSWKIIIHLNTPTHSEFYPFVFYTLRAP